MKLSKFGKKAATTSGISLLMDDLGTALAQSKDVLMLGGGNPAHIPEVQACFRQSAEHLLATEGLFEKVIGDYDPPQGNQPFIEAIAALLQKEFAWDISPENIALTNGSQSAFFYLFNIFAGPSDDGIDRKILLPLAPEYIGYTDVGIAGNIFVANKPTIEHIDEHIFKYHVDFDQINITEQIGAICVSRPTNPTGNVLTDCEIEKLSTLAKQNDIPLIIDNAYGTPFPNIIFTEAKPVWDLNTIVCMSLSKLGLPATRTGIVIAAPKIIKLITELNAVINLAPNSIGARLAEGMVRSGKIIQLSREVIKPFYQSKAKFALDLLSRQLAGTDYHIHKPEGSIFLWLWLRDLPITSEQLYQRLKKRNTLVVPGEHFFPGLEEDWPHKKQCIRINYSPDENTVTKGIKIIAEEVKQAYSRK